MSRESAKEEQQSVQGEPGTGAITGPAQGTLKGERGAQELLTALVAPRLRHTAQRFLESADGVDLSPEEVASLTIETFAQTPDFDLRSRKDFFAFADRQAAAIVARAVKDRFANPAPLLGASAEDREPRALMQAIHEINAIDVGLAHLLRSQYVLDLKPSSIAAVTGEPEAAIAKRSKQAESLLLAKYNRARAGREADPTSLDSSAGEVYSESVPLAPSSVSEKSASSSASPELVSSLRAEVADLQSKLSAAEKRIVEFERQAETAGPDTSATRTEIDALLRPASLDDVPLCTATHLNDLWNHLETYYGQWLAHFGADRDYISLDQISKHDPAFIKKLTHRISRQRALEKKEFGAAKTPTLGKIMPTETDRVDLALAGLTVEELFDPTNRQRAVLVGGRLMRHLYGK